jgi:hypothetical protein
MNPNLIAIIHVTIGIVIGLALPRIWIRPSVTRDTAQGQATQSFSEGDPLIQLLRSNGQQVTIHAGALPDHVLGRLFGAHDIPSLTTHDLVVMTDPRGPGKSKVIVDETLPETDLLLLQYVEQSEHREPLVLQLSPAHRDMLGALGNGEELDLVCTFAEEPGLAEIGVFTPA